MRASEHKLQLNETDKDPHLMCLRLREPLEGRCPWQLGRA